MSRIFSCALALSLSLAASTAQAADIQLSVDAAEAPRHIFHSRLTIPVAPGPLVLYYPKWTPGEHGPTGPITDLTGLHIRAGSEELAWHRDAVDAYAFHVEVPADQRSIEVALDYVSPVPLGGPGSEGRGSPSSTDRIAIIDWHLLLLYPAGTSPDVLRYAASLRLPSGWQHGTALAVAGRKADTVEFQPVSLTTLIDSPVLAGTAMRSVELTPPGEMPHWLHLAADGPAALALKPETERALKRLIVEARMLFGARHYTSYHFLLALSDHLRSGGLEHHESSDNRIGERSLIDAELFKDRAGLLPHEFVHSWNGKYRRPQNLTTPNYQEPMQTDLLWVYEGLTTYLGNVLTTRSGLNTPALYREGLALDAANMDHRAGRSWRPLLDTAVAAPILRSSGREWEMWRRSVDYYPESNLIWLEADALIRERSRGRRSLGDFVRRFHGGTSSPPMVKTYTFDDVVTALGDIEKHDWRSFLMSRLESRGPGAPLGGLQAAGWRLVYTSEPNELLKSREAARKYFDATFSIGIQLRDDGTIIDIVPGMVGAKAGLAPGMKVLAVGGRRFTAGELRNALAAAHDKPTEPIEMIVENADFVRVVRLDYHDGERFPHLLRVDGRADRLSEILAPLAPPR